MNRRDLLRSTASLLAASALPTALARALEDPDPAGYRPLFNGNDLSGWVPVNVAPETFSVVDGTIVSTGFPTGVLRTDRPYENFIIELEWAHQKPGGNAGLFVWGDGIPALGTPFTRGTEVQILDGRETPNYTSHGDVFPIHGATFIPDRPHPGGWLRCLPLERRANPSPGWNHYRVTCVNGVIQLEVNGKYVSGGRNTTPRQGYICLESEGSPCHFRNIRIRELPSTDPTPSEMAILDEGFHPLYTGLDLRGWKQDPGHVGHWTPRDSVLAYDGKSESDRKDLWTEAEFGDFEMIVDWRLPGEPKPRPRAVIEPSGDDATNPDGSAKTLDIPYAGDSGILLRGSEKAQINITCNTVGSGELYGYRTDKSMPPEVRAAAVPRKKADNPPGQWNRLRFTLQGEILTVYLNNQLVIDHARLPGLPPRGPLALQHHGDPIEFTNLFIRPIV